MPVSSLAGLGAGLPCCSSRLCAPLLTKGINGGKLRGAETETAGVRPSLHGEGMRGGRGWRCGARARAAEPAWLAPLWGLLLWGDLTCPSPVPGPRGTVAAEAGGWRGSVSSPSWSRLSVTVFSVPAPGWASWLVLEGPAGTVLLCFSLTLRLQGRSPGAGPPALSCSLCRRRDSGTLLPRGQQEPCPRWLRHV